MLSLIRTENFILRLDTYKIDHHLGVPSDVRYACSTIVARKPSKDVGEIVAMGMNLIAHVIDKLVITKDMVDEAESEAHLYGYEFNRKDWDLIVNKYNGKLPLDIYGVEEGRVVKPQTPIMAFINTDRHGMAWLPSAIETWAQSIVWKMSTVASTARAAKKIIKRYMIQTNADMSMLDYKLQNFGDRGADGPEAAVYAGIGHAALFSGSDSFPTASYIKKIYNTDKHYLTSVFATEHSIMMMNSNTAKLDDFGAAEMMVRMLHRIKERTDRGIGIPVGSVVIDTYDPQRFIRTYMGGLLRDQVNATGVKCVFRPDSGDVTKEPGRRAHDAEVGFGSTTVIGSDGKTYKELPPNIGIIQGDGVKLWTIDSILNGFVNEAGFGMNSLTLGMGGGLTHEGDRDTFSFSQKLVAIYRDGKWVRLLKQPSTDITKKSLSGLVRPLVENGELVVKDFTDSAGEFFSPSAGWELYIANGNKTAMWTQSFDSVKTFANQGI